VDTGKDAGIYVASLASKQTRRLLPDRSHAQYVLPGANGRFGYLLFVRDQTLMAQPVNPPVNIKDTTVVGEAFPVAERVAGSGALADYLYSASVNGMLIFQSGGAAAGPRYAWFDRTGKQISTVTLTAMYTETALSPDAKRMVFPRLGNQGSTDLWVYDLELNTESRFTFGGVQTQSAVWSPDGARVVFASNTNGAGDLNIYVKASSGAGTPQLLLESHTNKRALDWSRDGKFILFSQTNPKTQLDLWALPVTGGLAGDKLEVGKPFPLQQSGFTGMKGQLSPDARWLAYVSNESGRLEVYVQPFAPGWTKPPSGKWQVSAQGGSDPRWRRDGKELLFLAADGKLMALDVKVGSASFERGVPHALFETVISSERNPNTFHYAVSPDGKRFLIGGSGVEPGQQLNVVVNWVAGLKK
jgi:eukaryotic-like serine/threonine-protein kinase